MTTPDATTLLACTLTFRESPLRDTSVPQTFETVEQAIATHTGVLLHEARETMAVALESVPEQPYLHPVDVDTDEPGIVDKRETMSVLRPDLSTMRRIDYKQSFIPSPQHETVPDIKSIPMEEAVSAARKEFEKKMKSEEKKAATAQRRKEKEEEKKEARRLERQNESPEEREERLREARQKRAERKAQKEAESCASGNTKSQPPEASQANTKVQVIDEEALGNVEDVSTFAMLKGLKTTKRRPNQDEKFFAHPLPHHRHLYGLHNCSLSNASPIARAVLQGVECEHVVIIDGPPGTGKTKALVDDVSVSSPDKRVLLVAPTNVGAVNLYQRCIEEGYGDECALCLPSSRIPVGTVVMSNDPCRRIVCATVSGRNGTHLAAQSFQHVALDEAAQCMEAWAWTLLRDDVERFVMAGDCMQLPALTSMSGQELAHDRSLMERMLTCLHYKNVRHLTIQHRMAPPLMQLVNSLFYNMTLTLGEFAPEHGCIELHRVNGKETKDGTSYRNDAESALIAQLLKNENVEECVVLTPYAAQCRSVLQHKTGVQVHTVDAYQGREQKIVFLSTVRDGTSGFGFWEERRRFVVALSRAREKLVVICSNPEQWKEQNIDAISEVLLYCTT